jgi:hypothetical protein
MMKVLSQARKPSAALGLYAESGVFAVLYPELDMGRPPADFAQTLRACDAVPLTRPWVRLSLLVALASATGDQGKIEGLMERLRFSNAATKRVAAVAGNLSPAPLSEEPAVLRRWLNRVGAEHFVDIARAWLASARGHENRAGELPEREGGSPSDVVRRIKALRTVLREGPPLTIADLALDGSDLKELGLPPGPQFGEILRYLLEEVLDRPELNNRADLEGLAARGGFLIDAPPDS